MVTDLIYDVGLHNGADTAYYLYKGFRVVAIDANPVLTAAAERRFKNEIAEGRLIVLNIGIAETEGTLSFWVNESNDTQSSFNEQRAKRYGPCHEILVPCISLSTIMAQHGVPYYMKVDIEGYDYLCIQALNSKDLPKYISVEQEKDHDLVADLRQLGYTKFKIVNQLTYTDSTPIADAESGFRLLRKASSKFPAVHRLLRRPSVASRLKKLDFDSFADRFAYTFGEGSSGPFGEETWGEWHSADDIRGRISDLRHKLATWRIPAGSYWFDIHATD
jgi:FkbM family methyltransferase